ncbi:MAG: hypothetical protein DME26_03410 [Verrucomicrobia bacterium]|nr:MAG: hypothetical protein DME26_03410 [Verrucomicrobiota bacterium]
MKDRSALTITIPAAGLALVALVVGATAQESMAGTPGVATKRAAVNFAELAQREALMLRMPISYILTIQAQSNLGARETGLPLAPPPPRLPG